jgi:hypothetical protein
VHDIIVNLEVSYEKEKQISSKLGWKTNNYVGWQPDSKTTNKYYYTTKKTLISDGN